MLDEVHGQGEQRCSLVKCRPTAKCFSEAVGVARGDSSKVIGSLTSPQVGFSQHPQAYCV